LILQKQNVSIGVAAQGFRGVDKKGRFSTGSRNHVASSQNTYLLMGKVEI